MADQENEVQISVNCLDPDVRAAWMGLITAMIREKQIETDVTVLEHQQASVDIALNNPQEVADMFAQMSKKRQLSVSIVEQIELPDNLAPDLLSFAGGMPAGILDLSGPGGSISKLGLDYAEITRILEETHRRVLAENDDVMTDEVAQQIDDETSEALREYVNSVAPDSKLVISAHHEKVEEGVYTFALAIAVDGAGGSTDAGQLAKELKRRRDT
jgi:hypothetical protein